MSLTRLPSLFRRPTQNGTAVPGPSQDGGAAPAAGGPKALRDFREQIKRGLPMTLDLGTIAAVVDGIRHTESIDDRKLLLEHALTFLSRLPEGAMANKLQNKVVELLYNDLAHPPATCIGNKYSWRAADGSFNNLSVPEMGRADEPYARSVQQSHPLPKNALPDPGLIFDTLLKREGFVKHPAGLSSLMFSFAALVIHSVFRTSHQDVNINETSSYVDLSPLYGHNQAAQDKVRLRDGRGLLYPDVFAEDRLLLLPPAVCALLVLFSRNHNYIAKKLYEINERGTYVEPSSLSLDDPKQKKQLLDQEEELFQVARLVNCGWFGSVVFSDYFSCILGLVRDGSSWSLNPFEEIRNEDHSVFERGKGNVCSVEFNCLYRWHATTSAEDEQWVAKIFSQIFDGKDPEQVTPDDFKAAARKVQAMQPDITHWTFGSLQRQEDGTFKDEDLANIIQNATEHPAAAFRARGTPAVMRLHEMMGIEQNRRWGVCSLNDFRTYLGLKPYASFREWNPDPEIADAAEKLYGNIDYLELYVGLQAEEAKPVVEGAGLCPGYTISRAILSDAIALTRGDRFFTYDYTPYNLTAWGFADCQRDPNAFGFGSTLGRLILRTLPNEYSKNSAYAFFPLMTPDSMKTNLKKLDLLDQYDVTRPKPKAIATVTKEYTEVAQILKNTEGFSTPYVSQAALVIKGKGFFIASTEQEQTEVSGALLNSPDSADKIGRFFYRTTRKLITVNSYSLVGSKTHAVDLVRDVLRFVPIHWAAGEIAGIQIKSRASPHGDFSADQLYQMLGDIYTFIFLDVEASKYMVLKGKVDSHVEKLLHHIKANLNVTVGQRLSIAGIVGTVSRMFSTKQKGQESHDLVKRLYEIGHSTDQLANAILAIMVSSVELSLALTNMVNLYIGSEKESELRALASSSDSKTQLDAYVYEALRLDPSFQGVYRIAQKDQTISTLSLSKGSRVFLDIVNANLNAQTFPDPNNVVLTRNAKERYINGDGCIRHLGETLTLKIMGEVLRGVFGFGNIRRAPGQSGVLKRFKEHSEQILRFAYLGSDQLPCAWPTSLAVQYDAAPASQD